MLVDKERIQATLNAYFARTLDSAHLGNGALDSEIMRLRVEVVREVDSTNTELMRRARAGDHAPILLLTERQSAGRGRLGRSWVNGPDSSDTATQPLMFSLGLTLAPYHGWSGLSLVVGLSLADTLDPHGHAQVGVKWPNDLWFRERKLCGILIETATLPVPGPARFVVIGIGINLAPPPAEGMRTAPAWLHEWRPDATAVDVLREIVPPLLRDLSVFCRDGFAQFGQRFAARDVLQGREVTVFDGPDGHSEGVGPGGELLLRTSTGVHLITSSEVSVRPRRPA